MPGAEDRNPTTEVPLLPVFDLKLEPEDWEAVATTLRSGWLTMGPRTLELESTLASRLGTRHVVALSSCTRALHLACLAARVGAGDEVIVPSLTFVATANAAVYCGATPVFAEITSLRRPTIDPDDAASRITPRTRAMIVVHYAGYAAQIDRLRDICAQHDIALIEDVAHAPCATFAGQHLGTFGLAGAFSLFSNKVLSVGEGGFLTTNDDRVAAEVRARRSHCMTSGTWERHTGSIETYDVTGLGYNYRIDEPRAALALARLRRLDADLTRRRALTHRYRELLSGLEGIIVPFDDHEVDRSSGYIMAIMLEEP